jgi:FkbM family methyltransferase
MTKKIEGIVSNFQEFGEDFSFFIQNPNDLIQKNHLDGKLYEYEELNLIRKYSNNCHIFYDIGSNVGNHGIFMAKVLNASKVYTFEANPFAAEILKINVLLNNLSRVVDTSYLCMGIGDKVSNLELRVPNINNIGGARLIEETAGGKNLESVKVACLPLDTLNLGFGPDFVKVDVEGMEISVLKGMNKIISHYKPHLFIEVDNSNALFFDEWLMDNDYMKIESFQRYPQNVNHLVAHKVSKLNPL